MKPALLMLLAAVAVASKPTLPDVSALMDPVDLTDADRSALDAAAKPHGHGAKVARAEAGSFAGSRVRFATVEFAPDQAESDYPTFLAVDCSRTGETWVCDDPYRVLVLVDECPQARIELRGQVSIADARKVFLLAKTREPRRFVTVTAIEPSGPALYSVNITYRDGFGVASVAAMDAGIAQK